MPKTQTLLAVLTTVALGALIGCAGGGGDGVSTGITNSTSGNGGNNGGNNNNGGSNGTATTTNAGTTGTPGALPANVVFYSEDVVQAGSAETQVRRINPDGSADTLYVSLPDTFQGLGLNPNVPDQVLFGFDPNGNGVFGLFRNSRVSGEGATAIVPPTYSSIDSISVGADGATVVFVATQGSGAAGLYRVPIAGGTPERLDDADDAALSPSGHLVAYSKLAGGDAAEIFVRDLRQAGAPARITNNGVEDVLPNWSRNGARLVFSRQTSDTNYDLFTVNAVNGGEEARVTNTENQSEFGASFSGDDAGIAATVLSLNVEENGLYVLPATTLTQQLPAPIKRSSTIREGTHWTNAVGRAKHRAIANLSLRLKKRKQTSK